MASITRALRTLRPSAFARALPRAVALRSDARTSCFAVGNARRFTSASASQVAPRDAPSSELESVEEPLETDDEKATAVATGTPFMSLKGSISDKLLRAITDRPFKFEHMTSVQEAVLPLLPGIADPYEEGKERTSVRDLLVRAKTGTGKTLAFLVPALEARIRAIDAFTNQAMVDASGANSRGMESRIRNDYVHNRVGILVISPTRELATQIANEAAKLAYHLDGFEVRLFTGGVGKRQQMQEWRRGRKDVVVTTPGRIRDLLENEPGFSDALRFTQTLILDEADTLLDMGFRDDIDYIESQLARKPERQTFLFSATIDKKVEQVAYSMLNKNHKYVNTVSEESSPVHAHVPQYHTVLPSATEQIPHILRLIAHDQLTNATKSKIIVFCNTTKMTQLFSTVLQELAPAVLPPGRRTRIYEIHSKKEQSSRSRTSDRFRNDKSGASILVTSDVSARGVDYPGVSRVIQVGIPGSFEQYIHRVGRTGRAGGFVGRGDLVLLPWEVDFPTYNLAEVALKPVTCNEFKKQLTEVATKFDENPPEAMKGTAIPERRGRRDEAPGPVRFRLPVSPNLEAMETEIQQLFSSIDEEAVRETFTSMLGFYSSRDKELRCSRAAILDGCRAWTTEACGLEKPPHISEAFIAKLGLAREERRGTERRVFGRNDRRRENNRWDDSKDFNRSVRRDRDFHRRDEGEDGGRGMRPSYGYGRGGGRSSGSRSSDEFGDDSSSSSYRGSRSSFGSRRR